jgi:hypothetical protein
MGNSNKRRKNVAPLAGGGSAVAGSGQIVLDCRFTGRLKAVAISGATNGSGDVHRVGDAIVLRVGRDDIAEIDADDPLSARLADCLDSGFEYCGVLVVKDTDATVNVRPRS